MKPTITVPTGYVKQLLDQVAEQNYDVNELLEHVGIDATEIETQTEFPADKFGLLYQHVMYITQDEYFGMLSGGKLPTGTFRMMCHAIIQCKTMEHAIRRVSDFHEIVRGTKIKPRLIKQGKSAIVSFTGLDSLDKAEIEAMIASEQPSRICNLLSMWHHFISWLIGERVELSMVNFTFSEDQAKDNCHTRFQSKYKYNHHENCIAFPLHYLDYPVVQTEETLHGFLKTAPYQLLVMVDDNGSLKAQVVALIGRDFSLNPPSAEKVARTLNMSLSTLRRRLLEENTTFQKIKDECRKNSAIKYISSPQLSINDVAELMGFEEPSAFFRSFKRWTGMTPKQYLKSDEYLEHLKRKN
jgi:AraC-like DNA-binding protein